MSSSTSSRFSGSGSSQSSSDLGYEEALLIGGAILGALIALATCRFALFFTLDICISLDGGRRRSQVAEFLRKIFPFWNVRTQPSGDQPGDIEASLRIERADQISLETLSEMIPFVILTNEDVEQWKKENSSSGSVHSCDELKSSNGEEDNVDDERDTDKDSVMSFPCSICLNELKSGEKVFKTGECNHVFHYECFLQWVVSSSNPSSSSSTNTRMLRINCPNCRTLLRHVENEQR